MSNNPTACLIIIGNEILSGRTQDKNLAFIGTELADIGIKLMEVRVIPDIESTIIDTVNACRRLSNYVFTTGGIGPTHDDITSGSIAKAFGVRLVRHPEAEAILRRHYEASQLNEARLKMADIPERAGLIPNPVSAAPGFVIGNVYVMAGVPSIMRAMFGHIKSQLIHGDKILSRGIAGYITEGTIAAALTEIQNCYQDVEIGSYPFIRQGKLGTSLVMRGTDSKKLNAALADIKAMLQKLNVEIISEE